MKTMIPIVLVVSFTHQKGVTRRTKDRRTGGMPSMDPLRKIQALRTPIRVIDNRRSIKKSASSLNTLSSPGEVIVMYTVPPHNLVTIRKAVRMRSIA